jgi:nitrogenase molybdenum-iron protein alpha/beta subunit
VNRSGRVNLIGEKNLEYEAEANYREVARLLSLLGVGIQLRFVRNIRVSDIGRLGSASLNILRDESLTGVGASLEGRFGTPFLPSFPIGFEGTLTFLSSVGDLLGIDSGKAIAAEMTYQKGIIEQFSGLRGKSLSVHPCNQASGPVLAELLETFELALVEKGSLLSLPDPVPVGSSGISRMLHRWQRVRHA